MSVFAPLLPPPASHISQYKDKWTGQILSRPALPGMDRFLLQLRVGTMPHAQMLRATERYSTVLTPAVRKAMA